MSGTDTPRPGAFVAGRREDTAPRTIALAAALVLLAVAVLLVQFSGLTDRPQGFYLDESSFAWNAWTILQDGVDEHGRAWPIFFESFGDWKTGPFIYLLAGVFAVTGPSILATRVVVATAGVIAVALLGALGYRGTRRIEVGLLTGLTALLLPWTFEPTRLSLEVALVPALIAGLLVALDRFPPGSSRASVVLLAGLLALLTYTYTLGRLLGPLLALGLIVYAVPGRRLAVLATWAVFGVLLVPFLLFNVSNPGALTVRLTEAGYLGRPPVEVVTTFAAQLLGNVDPGRWLLTSDANPRHHVPGIMGSMLVATYVLALGGLVLALRRFVRDPWSRYLVVGTLAALVPASLTLDDFHVHRLIALPVFLIALTIPAQAWLLSAGRGVGWRRAAFAVLTIATVAQGAWFQVRYDALARERGGWFDAEYPRLLDVALATGADPVYLEDGIVPGYVHGLWYGAVRGVPAGRFVHLPRDTRAPDGAVVLSSVTDCTPCEELDVGGFFKVYRIP